jgi:hypothetical protein
MCCLLEVHRPCEVGLELDMFSIFEFRGNLFLGVTALNKIRIRYLQGGDFYERVVLLRKPEEQAV